MRVRRSSLAPVMQYAAAAPARDRVAIAGSIAVHLCALAALALLPPLALPRGDLDERALVATLIHIEHRTQPPAPRRRTHARIAADAVVPVVIPPELHVVRQRARSSERMLVAPERPHATPVPSAAPALARESAPPAIAAQRQDETPKPVATPPPVSASAPTTAPAVQTAVLPGAFGSRYPARADGALLEKARSQYPGFTARVAIDENGRPTSVEILAGPADSAVRTALTSMLMAARYIPEEGDGLNFAGSVTIKT